MKYEDIKKGMRLLWPGGSGVAYSISEKPACWFVKLDKPATEENPINREKYGTIFPQDAVNFSPE